MVRFQEEFDMLSAGAYPMLKLGSAVYDKSKRILEVRFNIMASKMSMLGDAKKAEVAEIVASMFEGVKTEVTYVKTFADENVVRNRVLDYFNRVNEMIFAKLDEKSLKISVSDEYIEVKLRLETPIYMMYQAGGESAKLADHLDAMFNQQIDVSAEEIVLGASDIADEDIAIETTVVRDSSLRLIPVEIGEKIYTRGKVEGINQMPNYICDIKGALDNAVLCGRVSNISVRDYANKKYDPSNPKSGPERLPLARFILNDTTAKIECVCFPKPDEREIFEKMQENSAVVCAGKVSVSSYNSALSFAVNALFNAEIDLSGVNIVQRKGTPSSYTYVKPEPYRSVSQDSLFDTDGVSGLPLFKDKTYVILDFEATDRFPETAEPIELCALKVVNGEGTETFSTLIDPGAPIPERITEITHIDDAMVNGSPSAKQVIPDFYKFTRGAVLVGHNIIGYDYPLLNKVGQREGYAFDNDLLDTLDYARKYIPESHNHKLETLSKKFSISHENAHRAMSDVYATFGLLKEIARRADK